MYELSGELIAAIVVVAIVGIGFLRMVIKVNKRK